MKRKNTSPMPQIGRLLQSFAFIFCGILSILVSVADARGSDPADDGTYDFDTPYHCCGTVILPDKAISRKDGYLLTVHGVLLGVTLMLLGLALLLRGYHETDAGINSRFIAGFITMALVSWVILTNFEPARTYGTYRWTIYLVVCFVIGAIGGLIISCTFHLFLMVLSALGALAFGLWLLGWKNGLLISTSWGRALFLALLVLAGLCVTPVLWFAPALGAAFAGAYVFMLGLDIFVHTGFTYGPMCTLDANPNHPCDYYLTWQVYLMLAFTLVLSFIGMFDQLLRRPHLVRNQHAMYYSYSKGILPPMWGRPI
ncbi:hypothetical protein BC943DRAFT_323943 [Umbelopsis sp. AD052]|nr:hypothetical protein BC943DRAFT_323943 [Umbelopsis sp. AD052]